MSKVFVDAGMSLDGFMAGPNARPGNPLGDGGTRIHEWMYPTAAFCERLGFPGGQPGPDSDLIAQVFERAGAYIMGKRMFAEGETAWPENPPFRAPVFVVTHERREPWVRQGGTTFHFVTQGPLEALARAEAAAGGKDVRIAGGGQIIRQLLEAGRIDEINLHLAPVLLGGGTRLFEPLAAATLALEPVRSVHSARVTHLTYHIGAAR